MEQISKKNTWDIYELTEKMAEKLDGIAIPGEKGYYGCMYRDQETGEYGIAVAVSHDTPDGSARFSSFSPIGALHNTTDEQILEASQEVALQQASAEIFKHKKQPDDSDLPELKGQIVDIFEDYMDMMGLGNTIRINDDKRGDLEAYGECGQAIIYGEDYDLIADVVTRYVWPTYRILTAPEIYEMTNEIIKEIGGISSADIFHPENNDIPDPNLRYFYLEISHTFAGFNIALPLSAEETKELYKFRKEIFKDDFPLYFKEVSESDLKYSGDNLEDDE